METYGTLNKQVQLTSALPLDAREVVGSSSEFLPGQAYVGMFFYDQDEKHIYVVTSLDDNGFIQSADQVYEADDTENLKTRIKQIHDSLENQSSSSLGRINSDKTIEISDDLAPGEYEMKYEDQNGNVVEGWQSVGEFSKF